MILTLALHSTIGDLDYYHTIDGNLIATADNTGLHLKRKGNFGNYRDGIIYIVWSFDSVIYLINHEFMHYILDVLEDKNTCHTFDNIHEKVCPVGD